MSNQMTAKFRQCDIALPNQCILKCKMCNFWQNDLAYEDPGWLGVEEYKRILSEIRDFVDDPFCVSFGGGEPLLNDKLLEAAKICRDLNFVTSFPTNAYLIDQAMAEKIAAAEISSIGISLDSLDRRTHDLLRGKDGCWEKAVSAISLLKKYRPALSVNILAVIMGVNLGGIIELARWVYAHPDLHGIVFQAIQKPFNTSSPDNWFELAEYAELWPSDRSAVNAVIDELIALRRSRDRGFKICNPVSQLEVFKLYFSNPKGFVKPRRCHLADNVIRLDSFGNVIACEQMEFLGSAKEANIRGILYSSKARKIMSSIHNCAKNCYHLVNCFYDGESK